MAMQQPHAPATAAIPQPEPPDLIEPGYPMIMRAVSDAVFPSEPGKKDEPVMWVVGHTHPFISGHKVLRMFLDRDAEEIRVYCLAPDFSMGIRSIIPMRAVRYVEEAMPADIFADELEIDETKGEEDGEPEEPETPSDAPSVAAAPATNGTVAPS